MALKDKKITETGIYQQGVVSAPDNLTGSPAENKRVFDNLVRTIVAQSVNGLIDELAGESGAGEIGVSPVDGLSGSNVQELLAAIKAALDENIAEVIAGAAPAGYGLGETTGNLPTGNDLDNATKNGWYIFATTTANAPFAGYGVVGVSTSSVGVLQIAHEVNTTTSGYLKGDISALRRYRSGEWSEWEWITPPLSIGIEYRTTERFNGKPVYVKLLTPKSIPATGTANFPHGITNLQSVRELYGTAGMSPLVRYPGISGITVDGTNLSIVTAGAVSVTATPVIKYTKTS